MLDQCCRRPSVRAPKRTHRTRLAEQEHFVAAHGEDLARCVLRAFGGERNRQLRDLIGAGFWHGTLGWMEGAIVIWMPIYLVLMQKRVYRQGWFMTLLKGFLLGNLYLVLLSVGAMVNLAVSVVAM